MTEAKHTPGPWTQGWSQNGVDCVWLDGKTEPAIGMGDDDDWIDCGTEANARLIAAAPELLEALQAFTDVYGVDDVKRWMTVRDNARAAIAKATGK